MTVVPSVFKIFTGRSFVIDVRARDERSALEHFTDMAANHDGITLTSRSAQIKRDGAGKLYVGDATDGRFHARRVVDQQEVADWNRRYSHGQPLGMPPVLANAIEAVGGLR